LPEDEGLSTAQQRVACQGHGQGQKWLGCFVERPQPTKGAEDRIERVQGVQSGHVPQSELSRLASRLAQHISINHR